MPVVQTFSGSAARLACVLTLSLAPFLCADTPALLAMDEDSATFESDQTSVSSLTVADSASVPIFGDSFDERLKLTRDWFGARDQLANRGITLDTNLTQFFQGVANGGKEQTVEYGGKLDYYLNIDGGKASLREGFLMSIHAETRFGEDINASDGMFTFSNFNMAFPKGGEDVTGVTRLILSQSLSDDFVVFVGKINSLDDFVLNFTGRNGVERFMNSAMVANIINARTVPYST